jgi:hypothetical protein
MPLGVSSSPGGAIVGAWCMISVTVPHNLPDSSRIADCFSHPATWVIRSEVECGVLEGCGGCIAIPVRRRFRRARKNAEHMRAVRFGIGNELSFLYSLLHFLCIRDGFIRELGSRQGQWKHRGRSAIPHHNLNMSRSLETEAARDALQEIDE